MSASTLKSTDSSKKASQLIKAKSTDVDQLPVANCTLSVLVQRSDVDHKFENANVEIHGPSGRKTGKTNAQGNAVFSGLLPGLYSVQAVLTDQDSDKYGNPKSGQISVKANTSAEVPLQLSMRKVVIDLNLLGRQFVKHSQMFNGLPATLKANGKHYRGTIAAGRFECEVPSDTQSFEFSFAGQQGITYINIPTT